MVCFSSSKMNRPKHHPPTFFLASSSCYCVCCCVVLSFPLLGHRFSHSTRESREWLKFKCNIFLILFLYIYFMDSSCFLFLFLVVVAADAAAAVDVDTSRCRGRGAPLPSHHHKLSSFTHAGVIFFIFLRLCFNFFSWVPTPAARIPGSNSRLFFGFQWCGDEWSMAITTTQIN